MLSGKLITFINKIRKNKLFENFIYLTGLQIFNYILPLITLPYLIKVLQPEKFGLTIYAQTVMLYFIVLIDYGFNITATRRISIYKEDSKKISEVFNNVISTKLFLLLFSLFTLTLMFFFIPKFNNNWVLFLFTSGVLIGQVFFPLWLFQGLQDMKYLMYFNFLSRIIFTVLVFVIIKSPSDFVFVNLLNSLASIFIGILSIYFVKRKYNIVLKISGIKNIISELKDGWMVFLSNFSIQIYMSSNLIILSVYSNDTTIGYYTVAEKVILIIRQLLSVFSQVIFPHVCQLTSNFKLIIKFFKKAYLPFVLSIFLLCVFSFLFAGEIVFLLTGNKINDIVNLIRILSFVPFIVCLNIPAYQTLLAYNYKNLYSKILIFGAFISLAFNFILAYFYNAYGTALSVVLTEFFITSGLIIVTFKKFKLNNLSINL